MLDFTNVYPSLLNWAIVGLMAVTFITFFKWFFNRYKLPGTQGIADIFASV